MNRCIGCGIKLQNSNKDNLGYTKDLKNKYCERCFKTIHYNEERIVNNIDNYKIIDKVNKLSFYTIFITDLLNINEELITMYKRVNNSKILVINKCDLIPSNLDLDHIKDNIKNVYNIKEDIIFISAKKKYNLNKIIEIIEDNNNVILCGETSSGKSTLINILLDTNLTTSKYSNTTLDFIKLRYNDYIIYDSPGISLSKKEVYDRIDIKPLQINDKYIISISDTIIRLNGNITLFLSDKANYKSKKSDIILDNEINVSDNSDILIPGYGFIYVKKGINIKSNKKINIRKSIIGK